MALDDTTSDFSAGDFEVAASAIASPDETVETVSAAPESEGVVAAPEGVPAEGEPQPEATAVAKPSGPIPLEVHQKALQNARAKARDEALGEWRQRYGWAEQVPREDLERWGQTANRLLTDPVAYAEDLLAELERHPQYGPQIKAQTARRLAAYRQREQANQPPEPDVQIVNEHGQVVGVTYSAQQLQARDAWREAQLKAELQAQWQQHVAPLDKMRAQVEERDRLQQITTRVDQQLAEAATWPHFTEHQHAIGIEVQKGADLKSAYHTVFFRDIYPKTQATARADVLGHLRSKPAASTASPSGGALSIPAADADKSFEQLFAEKAASFGVG